MAKQKSAPKRPKPGAPPATPAETQKLQDFFRGLYRDPEKMDQFNAGAAGRQKVLAASNLSAAHQKLIKKGCIPDVIHALVGAPAVTASYMLAIDCQDKVGCEHPECLAFSGASKAGAGAAKKR